MKSMRHIALIVALVCAANVPVVGQSLKGHNAKSDVDVAADRIEIQDRADRAIFSGNVQVQQAGLSMSAARLTVAYANNAGSGVDIERLDASGGVVVRSNSETARGDFAVYDLNRRIITMIGGVELNQRGNQVRGGRLVIDLNSGRAVVDGSAVGGNGASGGRVSGRFTVSDRKQ